MTRSPFLLLACISITSFNLPCLAEEPIANVSGFAKSFVMGSKISNATITVLETGKKLKTDKNGHYGPFQYPVGKPITLIFEKWGFQTTQSDTVIVPPEGLTSPYNNITFQVPSVLSYHVLAKVIGAEIKDNACHVATTITPYHKTLDDLPQGLAGAEITLTPTTSEPPFYFGIFESGPLKDKTNPFKHGLATTSDDGGALYFNLPPSDQPYVMSARKNGVEFSRTTFLCRKGAFINISPPRGPMALPTKNAANKT